MKFFFYILVPVAVAVNVQAAYTNATLNITTCGSRLSCGRYTSIGAFSPLGGQDARSASFYNYSGFAAGFILQPQTAFSGLPDELNPDNDLDSLLDGEEIMAGSSLYNMDTDGDGLSDSEEVKTCGTSPVLADSDGDRLSDFEEVKTRGTNPVLADSDNDGLNDSDEIIIYGTNPVLADSDGDGMNDSNELVAGTSPTNRNDVLSVTFIILPNGQREVSCFGSPGHSYTYEYTDSIRATNWHSAPFEITGSGAPISFTDPEASSHRFYRIRVRHN